VAALTRFWFPEVPLARVAALRVLVYGFVVVDVALLGRWVAWHGDVPAAFYQPLAVGRLLPLPTPGPGLVAALQVLLVAAALVALSGRAPRLAGAGVLLLYGQWMVVAMSYGKVDHDRFALLVALAVLPTVGRAGRRDLRGDAAAGWAIRCVQVAVVATYLLAVLAKHRYGGGLPAWLDSTTFLRAVLRRGTPLGEQLASAPALLHAAQHAVVGFELLSPLLLWPGRARRAMLAGAAAFHTVTFVTIGIGFWPHVVCLAAFVPLEREAVRSAGPATTAGPCRCGRRPAGRAPARPGCCA
jgi:hypothetical protein